MKMKMKASKMSLPSQVGASCQDLITDKSGKLIQARSRSI